MTVDGTTEWHSYRKFLMKIKSETGKGISCCRVHTHTQSAYTIAGLFSSLKSNQDYFVFFNVSFHRQFQVFHGYEVELTVQSFTPNLFSELLLCRQRYSVAG